MWLSVCHPRLHQQLVCGGHGDLGPICSCSPEPMWAPPAGPIIPASGRCQPDLRPLSSVCSKKAPQAPQALPWGASPLCGGFGLCAQALLLAPGERGPATAHLASPRSWTALDHPGPGSKENPSHCLLLSYPAQVQLCAWHLPPQVLPSANLRVTPSPPSPVTLSTTRLLTGLSQPAPLPPRSPELSF